MKKFFNLLKFDYMVSGENLRKNEILRENERFCKKTGIKTPVFFFDKLYETEWIAVGSCGKESSNKIWVVKKMIINNNIHAFSNLYTANAVISTKKSNSVSRNQKVRTFQDEMTISKEAQTFNEMVQKIKNESEIRQDKVEEYSRKIADGSYNVASENIAASILSNRY